MSHKLHSFYEMFDLRKDELAFIETCIHLCRHSKHNSNLRRERKFIRPLEVDY